MAAHLDDMFSFCVEPGKVSASVEVRFIDNIKVFLFLHYLVSIELWFKSLDEAKKRQGGEEATCRRVGSHSRSCGDESGWVAPASSKRLNDKDRDAFLDQTAAGKAKTCSKRGAGDRV